MGADAYVTVLIKTITVKFLGDKEPFFLTGKWKEAERQRKTTRNLFEQHSKVDWHSRAETHQKCKRQRWMVNGRRHLENTCKLESKEEQL